MEPNRFERSSGVSVVETKGVLAGFMARSVIMTLEGEMQVQDVWPGTRVITRDSGMAVVKSVSHRRVATRAVRIKAGSLGHTRPVRDVTLPAGQHLLVRDWRAQALFGADQAMVPTERLVDGEFVTLREDVTMTLYELVFDRQHILYVDGLEVASHEARAATRNAA